MLLPIVLILLATVAGAFFACGTLPSWGSHAHGISLILWSRRLEGPVIVTAILLCAGLFVLVLSGKKRAWWLFGTLPVLAFFGHRLMHGPSGGMIALQDPVFVKAERVSLLPGTDLVVGYVIEGQPCAFPCAGLFRSPVVIRSGREKPVILFWTPWANRALAFYADRELRATDLEIVSTPDNTLVIYNTRLGEFINSVTAQTFDGSIPTGTHAPVPIVKTTWHDWKTLHPDTVVADLPLAEGDFSKAVLEKDILPGNDPILRDHRLICVVSSTQPIAVDSSAVTSSPLNLTSGQTHLLVVRVSGVMRAFNRELPGDLIPRFSLISDPKNKKAAWIDSDTGSEWSETATVIEGSREFHGLALQPIAAEDDVYLNVLKFWYPTLHVATDAELAGAALVEPHPVEKPTVKKRRR